MGRSSIPGPHKSFLPKDEQNPPDKGPGRNAEVDFKGKKRCNDTHASTTDPDARLYRKSKNTEARLRQMGHALMENRNALVVDVDTTEANGKAERQAAAKMRKRSARRAKSLGADKNYDTADFVSTCREHKVAPHAAAKKSGSAVDGRATRHETYGVSIRIRKRIEEIFGWLKSVGGLRKSRHIGCAKLAGQMLLGCAAYTWCASAASTAGGTRDTREGSVCPESAERWNEPPDSGLKTRKPRQKLARAAFSA